MLFLIYRVPVAVAVGVQHRDRRGACCRADGAGVCGLTLLGAGGLPGDLTAVPGVTGGFFFRTNFTVAGVLLLARAFPGTVIVGVQHRDRRGARCRADGTGVCGLTLLGAGGLPGGLAATPGVAGGFFFAAFGAAPGVLA